MRGAALALIDTHAVPRVEGASAVAFRGVHAVVHDDGLELRRPEPCPHLPAPLGDCAEERMADAPVPTHAHHHVAACGCACSGLVRWRHRTHSPLPTASLPVAVRTFTALFDSGTANPWRCWDRFCERAERDARWLALWSEMMAGTAWSDTDADSADALCDAAFSRGRPG